MLWLQSVSIAVHDYTVVHERTPCLPTITAYFQPIDAVAHTASATTNTVHSFSEYDTALIPALI
eukprot:10222795-Ditylum_brightwellii.AAC.1